MCVRYSGVFFIQPSSYFFKDLFHFEENIRKLLLSMRRVSRLLAFYAFWHATQVKCIGELKTVAELTTRRNSQA